MCAMYMYSSEVEHGCKRGTDGPGEMLFEFFTLAGTIYKLSYTKILNQTQSFENIGSAKKPKKL